VRFVCRCRPAGGAGIGETVNADGPMTTGMKPLLTIDVWGALLVTDDVGNIVWRVTPAMDK
jgi:hypothetical protein